MASAFLERASDLRAITNEAAATRAATTDMINFAASSFVSSINSLLAVTSN
jgi:hypothetical protein